MSCELWQEKIDAYVDAELPSEEMSTLDAHLRGCPSCAADAVRGVQLKRLTHNAGKRYTASPEFRKKVLAQVQSRPARRWSWLGVPQFAAVAAVLTVALLLWNHNTQMRQRDQVLAQVTDMHVSTLASANPVDVVSSDRHTVKPWFQGKVPFTFNLPELQGTPFTLLGARLVYFEHAPAAQLFYQYQQHHISVFIVKDTPELDRELGNASLSRQLSFTVETWDAGGLCYLAVSDAEGENLGKLVTLLKQASAKS